MRRIIEDFLRRWWAVYLGFFIAHFFLERFAAGLTSDGPQFREGDNFLTMAMRASHGVLTLFRLQIIFGFAMWLAADFWRGRARVMATLPISARDQAQALWIVTALVPAVSMTAISLLCIAWFSKPPVDWTQQAVRPILTLLTFPAFFGMQAVLAGLYRLTIERPIASAFFNFTLFLPAVAWYLGQKEEIPAPVRNICALALATVCVIGWFRRGQVVSQFAAIRASALTGSRGDSKTRSSLGHGGMQYLVSRTIVRATSRALALMALNLLIVRVNGKIDIAQITTMLAQSGFIFIFITIEFLQVVTHVRYLRTLPISTTVLTTLLMSLPLAVIIIIAAIFTSMAVVLQGPSVVIPMLKAFTLMIAIQWLPTVVGLWKGFGSLSYASIFAPIFGFLGLQMLLLRFGISHIPEWAGLVVTFTLLIFAFVLTRWMIARGNAAYKVRPIGWFGWQMESTKVG
jgi:hypothetical protein